MRLPHSILLLLAILLISGCYESTVPLAPRSTATVDSVYLGRWVQTATDTSTTPMHLVVEAADAHAYALDVCCADLPNLPPDTTRLQAFLTPVGDVTFANVMPVESDSLYYLFRIDAATDSTIALRPVGQQLFDYPPTTSDTLYAFVQRHLDDDRLYMDEALYFERARPIDLEHPFR